MNFIGLIPDLLCNERDWSEYRNTLNENGDAQIVGKSTFYLKLCQ
jgi:hypothetical protein